MLPSIGLRGFIRSAAAGSFLVCYGVAERGKAAAPVRITPPVVDRLTIQAVVDTNHDIFISVEREMPDKLVLCGATGSRFSFSA